MHLLNHLLPSFKAEYQTLLAAARADLEPEQVKELAYLITDDLDLADKCAADYALAQMKRQTAYQQSIHR